MSIECYVPDKQSFFLEEEILALHERPIPRHVAIIMDGNRRWVQKHPLAHLQPFNGHWEGAHTLQDIVEAAQEIGIEVLTVYAFSTENWARPKREIEMLFRIFETYLTNNKQRMIDNGVRFDVIGTLTPFPAALRHRIEEVREATREGNQIDFIIALNYGGRDEMRRAVTQIVEDCMHQKIKPQDITEELIGSYLDTSRWGDPDLLIRTSGELRVSNFLLWQLAYAEIYVTNVLWPDFTPKDFLKAVESYQERQRRRGQ